MPNWCENELRINVSTIERAKEIQEELKGPDMPAYYVPEDQRRAYLDAKFTEEGHVIPGQSVLSFDKLVPIPPEHLEADNPDSVYEKPDPVFHLHSDYWGTKWQPSDIDSWVDNHGELCYSFSSAWSPPLPIVKAIAEKFPDAEVTLKYMELGNDFGGTLSYQGGEEILDHRVSEDSLRDFAIQEFGYDDDYFDDY